MWRNKVFIFLVCVTCVVLITGQFFECHDDPEYSPEEGPLGELQFTWIGALQYIHVKNGTPHYFRVPRVILISRQFVLSTAKDAAHVPVGYALGNVVFGDYERDEVECRVTLEDIAAGNECDPAILLMPIADVLLHPEYKHFGAKYSIALMKLIIPVRSKYMLPACLPLKNYLLDEFGRLTRSKLFHVDFGSDVPRDFIDEDKTVERVAILPSELCFLYDGMEAVENETKMTQDRMACTTGCGFRSGAPTLIHEHTGHWSIVTLSQGEHQCPDPLRSRRPPPPPRHTMIHPYVPWITAAISGEAVGTFAKDDPFGFITPRASDFDMASKSWIGHWWMGGLRCYDRGDASKDLFRFYHEIFQVKPNTETFVTYSLEINSPHNTRIICVKAGMPYRLGKPRVWALDTAVVKIHIPMLRLSYMYRFQIEAWAYNTTGEEVLSDESSTSEESKSSDISTKARKVTGSRRRGEEAGGEE